MWKSQVLKERVDVMAISPQNDLVVCSGYFTGTFTLLDSTSGQVIQQCPDGQDTMRMAAWSADGMWLLISDNNHTVHLWGITLARTTKQLHQLLKIDTPLPIMSLSFADDHRCITMDHGVFPIPPQHRPPCAADDL